MKAFLPWVAAKNRKRRMMTTRTISTHGTYSSEESQKLSVTLLTKIDTELLLKNSVAHSKGNFNSLELSTHLLRTDADTAKLNPSLYQDFTL
jgi:hypothetical protein